MEIFLGVDDGAKKEFHDPNGFYLDACDWNCIQCNTERRVTKIEFMLELPGTVSPSHIPPLVTLAPPIRHP